MVVKRNLFVEHAANKHLIKTWTPPTCLPTFGIHILYYIKKPWRPRKQAQGLHPAHTGIIRNLLYKLLSWAWHALWSKECTGSTNPRYKLSSWKHFAEQEILRLYNSIIETTVMPKLKEIEYFLATTDFWTSQANHPL